jgi:hypothetical protein
LAIGLGLAARANRATRWRLTLDHALDDLRDASLDSAALIVRANNEEWWHTRGSDPNSNQVAVHLK